VALLQLKNVGLKSSIGSHYILQNISGSIAAGDRIALIGASGAGKTSLLRLINRLSELNEGAIYLDGKEIREIPVLELRSRVVLVLQESKLLGMTVREALAYPLQLRNLSQTQIHQRIMECAELIHLPSDWLDCTEVHLSVGQRQLVAIARAMILKPNILLMDEPTSALDAGRSSHLLQVLKRLTENGQMTILMAIHQLDRAQQFCNRLWYIHRGMLVEDSPSEEVNWHELQNQLIQAETLEAEEWI